jgi:F0F1-type ATP synthase membrane subunit b/b'
MALGDRLKDLRSKAEDAMVERKDQIEQAVERAGALADEKTGGKYHDQIQKAGGKAVGYVESLKEDASESDGSSPPAP